MNEMGTILAAGLLVVIAMVAAVVVLGNVKIPGLGSPDAADKKTPAPAPGKAASPQPSAPPEPRPEAEIRPEPAARPNLQQHQTAGNPPCPP